MYLKPPPQSYPLLRAMSLLLLRYLVLLFLLPKHFLRILNRYLLLELTLFLCHTALHFMFLLLALTAVFLLRRLAARALPLADCALSLRTAHHPSRMAQAHPPLPWNHTVRMPPHAEA